MNCLELEQEISKMARAMMTRNTQIGEDLIAYLRTQLTLEGVAGVMLVSIERVIWFDTDSVFWTIQNVIPADVMEEVQKMTAVALSKRLISQGFVPGKDFSAGVGGRMLLTDQARIAVLPLCGTKTR